MALPSLARAFFEQITGADDPVAAIRRLINSDPPTIETDWLEFKTEPRDQKQRDRKIRAMWSEALGGFANNQGGVLLWGLDARKTTVRGMQIEAACAERPMADPVALKSRLIELQRQATDPPLANVEVEAYEPAPGAGFVVCYVPEGPFKPYRSEQAGQQWYLRAGDNFVVMSRSVLQSMFYPRSQAVFRVTAELSWGLAGKDHAEPGRAAEVTLQLYVANRGTATAKDVMLRVQDNQALRPSGTWQRGTGWDHFEGGFLKHQPMHPGTPSSLACTAKWTVPLTTLEGDRGNRPVPSGPGPGFRITVFAENQGPQHFVSSFDTDELARERVVQVEASPRQPPETEGLA